MKAASEENVKGVAKVDKEIRQSAKQKPGFIIQDGEMTPKVIKRSSRLPSPSTGPESMGQEFEGPKNEILE